MFKCFSKRPSKPIIVQQHINSGTANTQVYQPQQLTWVDDFQDKPIHILDHPEQSQLSSLRALLKFKRSAIVQNVAPEKGIGVFSDTPLYSDFIRSSLQILEIDIQNFEHPATFQSSAFQRYDNISAWIIFLSDSGDHHFLDQFLNRYVDKPTLFLCPQTTIVKTSEKINQFVAETGLFNLPNGFKHKDKTSLV